MNIDKYRLAATITEYHIISKLIFIRLIIPIIGQFKNNRTILTCQY